MHEKFFYKIGEKTTSLFKIQLIWLLFNIIPIGIIISLKIDISNLPIYLIAATVMGPFIFALIRMGKDVNENINEKYFSRFILYAKQSIKDALVIWLPYLIISAVLIIDFKYAVLTNPNINVIFHVFCLILWIFITLIVLNMMIIASFFDFEFKSLLKLSIYFLLVDFSATLLKIGLLVILFATLFFLSSLFPFLIMSLFMYLSYESSRKMIRQIRFKFISSNKKIGDSME